MPFLFPFEPDWGDPVEVEIAYKTEVIASRSYREQRIAVRVQPRKTVKLRVTALRDVFTNFLRRVAVQQQAEWVLPEITRAAHMTLAAESGDTSVQIDAARPWAAVGAWIVLRAPSGLLMRQLTGVAGGVLSFAAPLPEDIPALAEVCPGLIGRLSQNIRATMPTNSALRATIEFVADPGSNVYEGETTPDHVFNGRELFLRKANWGSVPNVEFQGFLETGDTGRGVLSHFIPVDWNAAKTQLEFVVRGTEDADDLTAFFHRMKGQQGEFYHPSPTKDFDLSIGASLGDLFLDVPGVEVFDLYAASTVHKAVWVKYRDGSWQANVIDEITVAGADSRITVVDPWAQDVNEDNVSRVSWLLVHRLSVDTMQIGWLTRHVARTKLTMQTIEDLE